MDNKKPIAPQDEKISKKKTEKTQYNDEENKVVKFQEFIENNRKKVIYIASAIIAVTLLFFVGKAYFENKAVENKEKCTLALNRILPYYAQSDWQRALNGDPTMSIRGEKVIGLVAIANEYSNEQGKIAALYAGNSFLAMSKPADAKKYFEMASGADSKLVQMGAEAGIGSAYEMQSKFSDAIKHYQAAYELAVDEGAKTRYQYYAAVCYEKSGDKANAEKLYREIIDASQYSDFIKNAKIGLVRIGTIIE